MKLSRGLGAVALIVSMAPLAGAVEAKANRPLFKEGEVIVKFRLEALKGIPEAAMRSLAARADSRAQIAKTMAVFGQPHKTLVRFPKDASVASMVARFKAMPGVEYAEPNYFAYATDPSPSHAARSGARFVRDEKTGRARAMTAKEIQALSLAANNDADLDKQAGWFWAGGDIVWPDTKLNPMIAILDTGVDYMHPDLLGKVVKGTDWINNDNDPMDDNGHGTHCAGIAAAKNNNKIGVAGMSSARIYAVKVLDGEGSGTYFDISNGIIQAANYPLVKVISMSLGGGSDSNLLSDAVDYAVNTKGKLIVAAAGNGINGVGVDEPNWPAFYANSDVNGSAFCAPNCTPYPTLTGKVMAVAADGLFQCTDPTCTADDVLYLCKAQYSNFGNWVTISAPGSDIFSTTPHNRPFWLNRYEGIQGEYDYLSGTSMATPMVAGAASRLLSTNPALTNAQLATQLVQSGFDTSSQIGNPVDADVHGVPGVVDCWPTGSNPSMTDLTVAGAMQRTSVRGSVNDAANGNALVGAKVTAVLGTTVKGFGGIVDSGLTEAFRIINLPQSFASNYTLKVQKVGYTAGAQPYLVTPLNGALDNFVPAVSVPPSKNWWFVTDWTGESAPNVAYELDQYLYTPSSAPITCSVGFYYYASCGAGSLTSAPFARSMHDGGPFTGSTSMESTAVKPPLYSTTLAITPYEVFVDSYQDVNGGANFKNQTGAIARVWLNGVMRGSVAVTGATDLGTCVDSSAPTGADCAWHVGNLSSAGIFTPVNELGAFCHAGFAACPAGVTPPGIAPYSFLNRVSLNPRSGTGAVLTPAEKAGPRRQGPTNP